MSVESAQLPDANAQLKAIAASLPPQRRRVLDVLARSHRMQPGVYLTATEIGEAVGRGRLNQSTGGPIAKLRQRLLGTPWSIEAKSVGFGGGYRLVKAP